MLVRNSGGAVSASAESSGPFHRWQSCIGLPSRAKLALRRAAMAYHYYSYPRTPFAASRRSPQGETRNLESPSFCLPDRNGAPRSGGDRPLRRKGAARRRFLRMSHIRPLRGLGFSAKSLLSSGACGATFFQRKKALALRHAALVTLRVIP